MRFQVDFPAIAFLLVLVAATADAQEPIEPIKGIGPSGEIRVVHEGFKFTEGPAADPNGRLYFTDIRSGRIYRANPGNEPDVILENSKGTNGLMFDGTGRLFGCQGGNGQIISIDVESKQITSIADQYESKRFNRPNDLVIDRQGGIYFTDPKLTALAKGKDAFYYATAAGEVIRIGDALQYPNGIILSPDESKLYVLPYRSHDVMVYEIESPGKIDAGKVLCKLQSEHSRASTGGDGLSIDIDGNLYVAVPAIQSIQVVSPQGKTLGLIQLPEKPSNCAFGGTDMKTLYITAREYVYALPMEATGHRFRGAP